MNRWKILDEFLDFDDGQTWNFKMPALSLKDKLDKNRKIKSLSQKWQLTTNSDFWVWIDENCSKSFDPDAIR